MDSVIKLAIKQPIAVAAFVFLIIAFGIVALQKIPNILFYFFLF